MARFHAPFWHEWGWEITHRDPFTIRRICQGLNCTKKGPSVSTKLAIQRSSICYFCKHSVTTWRTYADGTVACLECVVKEQQRKS